MGVEQFDESAGEGAQCTPRAAASLKKRAAAGGCVMQAVHGAMCAAGALVIDQRLDMSRILDLRAAIEAARHASAMTSAAIQDAHGLERGEELERAAHVGVGDGVVVQVEAHVGGLAGAHRQALLAGKGLRRQGEQSRLLLLEAGPDAAVAIFRTGPLGGLARAPLERLGVQVGHVGEAPGGEEALANKADRALDAALLIAAGHRHGARLEVIPGGELKQRRVEADRIVRCARARRCVRLS